MVKRGETVAEYFTDRSEIIDSVSSRITNSFEITDVKPKSSPLVISVVDRNGVTPFRY